MLTSTNDIIMSDASRFVLSAMLKLAWLMGRLRRGITGNRRRLMVGCVADSRGSCGKRDSWAILFVLSIIGSVQRSVRYDLVSTPQLVVASDMHTETDIPFALGAFNHITPFRYPLSPALAIPATPSGIYSWSPTSDCVLSTPCSPLSCRLSPYVRSFPAPSQ